MEIKKSILSRIGVVYVVTFLVALAILGQVLYIQMVSGETLRAEAESVSETHRVISSSRGNILARDESALASSLPRYDVAMDPNSSGMDQTLLDKYLPDLAAGLSRMFPEKTAAQYIQIIRKARSERKQYVLLHKDASFDEARMIQTLPLFKLGQYKGGLILNPVSKREKPYQLLASRTIGYVSEGETVVGIEGSFDYFLKGTDGRRLEQRLGGGTWMPLNTENEIEPVDGLDVVTTLDVNYQDVAETALHDCLITYQAEYGCAVLMEVSTGEILAMANLGLADDGNYYEIKNYAINECLEPGSTFKVPSIMAALEDGYVKPTDTIQTYGGKFSLHNQPIMDAHTGGFGLLTVQEVVEKSSNIGMARIIDKYYSANPEHFLERIYGMGINKPLNLEIEGGQDPRIKTPASKTWSVATVTWMAFGYEVELTPLQILTFYNAIANNGTMVKPRLVKCLKSHSQIVKSYKTEVLKPSICSKETLTIVKSMLEGAVTDGTAKNLKNDLYPIAGKTGTAVISQGAKGYKNEGGRKDYRASFVGYFPADNPRYSCIVVVSRPTGPSYYGAVVSGSVFKAISDKVFATNLEMQKNLTASKDTSLERIPVVSPGDWSDASKLLKNLNILVSGGKPALVWAQVMRDGDRLHAEPVNQNDSLLPSFIGMGLKDVLPVLENMGYKVKIKGSGRIISQSPPAGTSRDSVGIIEFQLAAL
ncbi:MAG: PASTA domain-containing protein [Porphyromonadaceae bacterium]|nr:MAG: PASTA domain-containing protein [Porphyromonadaceae bacterium]